MRKHEQNLTRWWTKWATFVVVVVVMVCFLLIWLLDANDKWLYMVIELMYIKYANYEPIMCIIANLGFLSLYFFHVRTLMDKMNVVSSECSSLKLVYIFSVNPYLGPLQISLGRMVMDIMKFFFLYILVLFAFSCG